MKNMWFARLCLFTLMLCFWISPALANEDIPANWYGPEGVNDPYALISRSTTDATDPTLAYTPSPAEWRDRNIYQLFTDRFATDGVDRLSSYKPGWRVENISGDARRNYHHGGSWKGLEQQIPYLQGMGITAVWISGVQQNDQGTDTNYTPYHQYHAENFFRCDPAMGTFQDLKDVIDALHAAGIAVILDVAPNHMCDKNGIVTGNINDDKAYHAGGHSSFNWWNSNNKHWPPFDTLDYFHNNGTINNWDADPENKVGQFKGTDDLKTESSAVSDILVKAFKNLIDATDCDGFRVDAIKHMPYDWCRWWAQQMLDHAAWRGKNNFLMFGELFVYNNQQLGSWCHDGYGFNSALLFPLMQAMDNAFGSGYSSYQLGEEINQIANNYGQGATRAIAFLDNHDVNRFAQKFGGGSAASAKKIMSPAMTFLYLAPPVPLLYYGTEHMFNQGGHANGANWSPTNDDADWQREAMFNKGFQPGNAEGDKFSENAKSSGLYYHIGWLNDLRNKSRALRRGGFTQRAYSSGQGIYAFTKWYGDEVALVIVNTSDNAQSLGTINAGKGSSQFYENGDSGGAVFSSDGSANINFGNTTIDGKGSKIYICNFVDNSADLGGSSSGSPWARGTHAYPATGAEAGSPLYINTEAGPAGEIATVELVHAFNPTSSADWGTVLMTINTNWDSDGGAWYNYEFSNPPQGTLEFAICVTLTNGSSYWDNNSEQNYTVSIGEATTPQNIAFASVASSPTEPLPGGSATITAAITYDIGTDVGLLACGIGYAVNPAAGAVWPVYAMAQQNTVTNEGATTNLTTYFTYAIDNLVAGTTIKYYLEASNGAAKIYANNGGNDYEIRVQTLVLPSGLVITDPAGLEAVTSEATYLITGTAGENLLSPISWTSDAGSGTLTLTPYWSFLADLLPGTNTFTFSAPIGATGTNTVAQDSGGNYTNWTDGSNLGTGFGAWVLSSGENAGHFISGDLFGLWSQQDNLADAVRPFSTALVAGDVFEVLMQNNWVVEKDDIQGVPGGGLGVALQDSGGNTLWQIWFNGGQTHYSVTGSDPSDIAWTNSGLNIRFTMTSADTYEVTVTPIGGTASTFFGSLSAPVARFRTWSYSNQPQDPGENSTSNWDYFFGNLKISRVDTTNSGTFSTQTVVIVQDGDLGVPEEWLVANGITNLTATSDKDGDGFTDRDEYFAGLNPNVQDQLTIDLFDAVDLHLYKFGTQACTYVVQYADYLDPATREWNWTDTTGVVSSNGVITAPTLATTSSIVLFRAVVTVPSGSTVISEWITLGALPAGGTFSTETVDVTLSVSGVNVAVSSYLLGGAAQQLGTFTNGQVLSFGSSMTNGESQTLLLAGATTGGVTNQRSYIFTKNVPEVPTAMTFVGNVSLSTNNDATVNVTAETSPIGAATAVDVVYNTSSATGNWPTASLAKTGTTSSNDVWAGSIGPFAEGAAVQLAVSATAGTNPAVWANNDNNNYWITIPGNTPVGGDKPYSTNPTKGQYRSGGITIDGANTGGEWTDNMLIALDMANDDPRSLGDNWTMHEAPLDFTHLWACWDDNNVYLAWQMVDVTDVLDPSNAGSGDPINRNDGILMWMVLDTKAGGSTGDMWSKSNTWSGANTPDFQIYMAGSLWQSYMSTALSGNTWAGDSELGSTYKTCANWGISIAKSASLVASSVWGVDDCDDRNNSANLRNFLPAHTDTTRDSFYEIKIPMSAIGITKAQLESSGIAVMVGAGSQSALDTIPNSSATTDSPGVEVWNSSFEWSDSDAYTEPFARIGN